MKAVFITSSILIVLIAALRPILRGKITPRVQYALWLIVALRLLVPVNLATSAYSALALLDRAEEPPQIIETIGQTPIPVQSYDSARAQVIEGYHQQGVKDSDLTPGDLMDIEHQAMVLMQGPTLAELAEKLARPVWLGGAVLMAAWFAAVNLRLRRKLKGAKRLAGVDCPLPVYISGALPSPCLCGAVRPAIYVTPAALESPARLRHVLAHELTHYRHKDHWWALLRCLCLCLYWFDPLVWWAAALSRQDCELACDAGAIRTLGEGERIPYGRTLVSMIAAGRNPLLQTATTMTGGKRRVRERVGLIARKPKTVIAAALALAVILGLAVGCTFTGAPQGTPGPEGGGKPMSAAADSLAERLRDIPAELQADVAALPGSEPTATLNNDFTALAQYWMNRPWADYDEIGMGWLLTVYQWDQEQFKRYYPDLEITGGVNCFAKDDKFYYVTFKATDARAPLSETGYADTFEAIRAFAEKTVLETEGVEPFEPDALLPPEDGLTPEQRAIQTVADDIINAQGIGLTLAPAGTSRVLAYPIPSLEEWDDSQGYWAYALGQLPTEFKWAALGDTIRDTPQGDCLMIQPDDSLSCIWLWSDSDMAAIRTPDNRIEYYEAQNLGEGGAPLGTFVLNPGPYQILRGWFDLVELTTLRTTSVPDRGQSHLDVVNEWIEGFMPYTQCAPGSQYACTYVRPIGVTADQPNWISPQELDYWAESQGYDSAGFGKTWFGFSFSLVFVPENENAKQYFLAGNTADYPDEAPEGAQIFSRVGYMELIDGNWVCEGVGTGW